MKTLFTVLLVLLNYSLSNEVTVISGTNYTNSPQMRSDKLKTTLNVECESIKGYEDFKPTPYRDVDGDWLIGYGFKRKFYRTPNPITKYQADTMLYGIIRFLYNKAKNQYPKAKDVQLAKIAHLYYWVGIRRTKELGLIDTQGRIRINKLNSKDERTDHFRQAR